MFARPQKPYLVLADHITPARHRKSDAARLTRPSGHTSQLHRLGQADATTLRSGPAQYQRRSGRRIDLVLVVRLEDLDVIAVGQCRSGTTHQRQQHVERQTGVGRNEYRNARSCGIDCGKRCSIQARGADEQRHLCCHTCIDVTARDCGR